MTVRFLRAFFHTAKKEVHNTYFSTDLLTKPRGDSFG